MVTTPKIDTMLGVTGVLISAVEIFRASGWNTRAFSHSSISGGRPVETWASPIAGRDSESGCTRPISWRRPRA